MAGNPLSGHTKANESSMAGTAKFTDGLTDGEHIQSPTLTNYLEGIHGNGILLEEDTAYSASNKNVPEDLPGVVEQNTNVDRIRVTGGTAIIDGVPYQFANGPGGTLDIDLTTSSAHRRATYSALTSGQEALIVVYVSAKPSVNCVQWEMGTAITTATNAYPTTPSAFLNDPDTLTTLTSKQSVVLAVLRVVYDASAPGDLKVSVTESNDKRIFIRPSPIYFSPVTSGAVGAVNAPVDSAAEIDGLITGASGNLAGSRLGALWQSHGTQLSSTTAPDNEKDTLYYSGNHAARYTRSVFDRVLTSTATSITLKSTDANILLLTPGGSATVTTSGSFPAGYIIELRNLHASNAVVFTRASNYSVAGGTLTRFVCTTSHATTPVFSVLSDDSIETVQLADNAVTLAKLDGIPRGKIIVGDASGDPSHLAAGSNGKLLVADANGDPSWTTVSGDVTISAGAVTIGNDKIDSQHYVDGSIDTAHIGDDQVTYAKIQNVSATDRLLGRDSAGAGIIEEISPADVRTMLNVADGATASAAPAIEDNSGTPAFATGITKSEVQTLLNVADGATANAGTVTSIATSAPITGGTITGTGTIGIDAATTGSAGSMSAADKTKLDGITAGIANGEYLVANANVADDDFLRIDGTSVEGLTAAEVRTALNVADGSTANAGTVTSIAVSGSDGIEIDSGSPITTSGTIALGVNKTNMLSHLNVEDGADVTNATNVNAAGAVMESDVDAKGDIFVATADNTVTRLAVGTNNHVLTADSSEASGVKWAAASGGSVRTVTAGGNTLGSGETLAFTEGSNIAISESGGAVTIAGAALFGVWQSLTDYDNKAEATDHLFPADDSDTTNWSKSGTLTGFSSGVFTATASTAGTYIVRVQYQYGAASTSPVSETSGNKYTLQLLGYKNSSTLVGFGRVQINGFWADSHFYSNYIVTLANGDTLENKYKLVDHSASGTKFKLKSGGTSNHPTTLVEMVRIA
tara:strand:+ start:10193 stop:13129 length:2937 start_codon:yes stop_codon:yes gene_type:complete